MKKGYYVAIAALCLVIGVSVVVLVRLLGNSATETEVVISQEDEEVYESDSASEYSENEDVEYAVTEDRMNDADMHEDAAFVAKHDAYVATGADYWEPPIDWELPEHVFNTLTDSVIDLYSSMDYTESVKLQYAMYMYFGEDMSGIVYRDDTTLPGPEGVELYWSIIDPYGDLYAVWMDYYNGFILVMN